MPDENDVRIAWIELCSEDLVLLRIQPTSGLPEALRDERFVQALTEFHLTPFESLDHAGLQNQRRGSHAIKGPCAGSCATAWDQSRMFQKTLASIWSRSPAKRINAAGGQSAGLADRSGFARCGKWRFSHEKRAGQGISGLARRARRGSERAFFQVASSDSWAHPPPSPRPSPGGRGGPDPSLRPG